MMYSVIWISNFKFFSVLIVCAIQTLVAENFYDKETNEFVKERSKRQMAVIGESCLENTDCRRGAYCDSTRRCACLSTYTKINGYCWQKINPGEAGCTHNLQCSAVWPNAYCNGGSCRCGNNQPPFETGDGPVCVNYGFCPINGENTKLKDSSGTAAPCPFGIKQTCSAPSYDCICSTPSCTVDAAGTVSSVTFCCPSRALACIMPLDQGSTPTGGGGSVTRWYHNSVTGNCETFSYRGNGGNANNFETEDQCVSYCMQSCKRGDPQYDPATYPKKVTPIRYCTSVSSSACDSNHYCYDRGTNSICCPTSSYICSSSGGVNYTQQGNAPTTAYDPGNPSDTTVTFARYYYDATRRQCLPFTYTGQGGNFNNFLNEEQCSRYCALTVCQAGEPLRDRTGLTNLACTGSTTCPATHECRNQVCCPRKQTVCSQSKAVGQCGNYVERWWYNAATRNCELFTFSGCQGNDNNFNSYGACQTFCQDATVEPVCIQGRALKDSYGNYVICGGTTQLAQTCPANYLCYYDGANYGCCPTQAYTCALNFDQGTVCGPTSNRWYYNSAQRRCITFTYNGCDGNSNNFATQTDCRDYCGVGGCPEGGEPFKESTGQYRVCTGGTSCPSTHYCTQVNLGSTGTTSSTTYNYCCPTKTYVCSSPRDQGIRCGSSTLTRYYFNVATRNCETMNFNGCEGNRNNFATMSQCLNYCNSAGCPAGQIALQDLTNNQLSTCQPGNPNSCGSAGYTCTYSTLLGQNICCGASVSADTCPPNQSAYISPFTNSALQCQPNIAGSCPSGFSCWYAVTQNQYFCCGSAAVQCPKGGSPYIESGTNQARQCTPGVVGACPNLYTCQSTTITIGGVPSTTGYCCGSENICGTGYESYYLNNQPVPCSANSRGNVCPSPYSCRLTSASDGQYYCCRPTQTKVVDVCGQGRTPYVINNAPVVCSTGSTSTNCPNPYQCLLYSPTNTFYCCQQGGGINPPIIPPTPTNRCPPGYNPLLNNGQYTYCSPSSNNCPGSFPYCQFDQVQSRYICCGSGQPPIVPPVNTNVCPPGLTGQMDPSTRQTRTCTPGIISSCSPGYNCVYSRSTFSYYCCGSGQTTTQYCPTGLQVYVSPISNQPQVCSPGRGFSSCPGGYQCLASAFGSYYCCGSGSIPFQPGPFPPGPMDAYGCPTGSSYLYPGTRSPLTCQPTQFGPQPFGPPFGLQPFGPQQCPPGYMCMKSSRYSGYQCCSRFRSSDKEDKNEKEAEDIKKQKAPKKEDGQNQSNGSQG